MIHLAWIGPLLLLIVLLGSPRFRGDIAERRVRRILRAGLEPARYTVFNEVVLPHGGGTVRIDHLVVSKSGLFVILSDYAPGHVSGTAVQERWKRRHFGRLARFDNPVHRSRVQAEAVAAALACQPSVVHAVAVLVGMNGFRGTPPPEVVAPEKLLGRIRREGQPLLDGEQVARALRGIEAARLQPERMPFARRVALLRWLLFVALLSGLWMAFGDDLRTARGALEAARERAANPADFHPDGRRLSDRERWEASLACALSPDTGRCACYDPQGERVDLPLETCRELAERGSILKQ